MRSRYSAYAFGELDYLKASWHESFLPANLSIDERICWLGLTIISSDQREQRATVEFEARLLVDGRVEAMHENSNFVRQGGRWLYTDGAMLAPTFTPWKPGRNEPCPCASGKKFKRCCAQG